MQRGTKMALSTAVVVLSLSIIATLFVATFSYPLHASCEIEWTFDGKCDIINKNIVKQIEKWTTADNCNQGGEKCLYKLVSPSVTQIKATHETPKKHYVDNLTLDIEQKASTCNVKGVSSSATWYAVLDKGTNYCNLHNLITGAGLDKASGYTETTSNSVCTQYSSADCETY